MHSLSLCAPSACVCAYACHTEQMKFAAPNLFFLFFFPFCFVVFDGIGGGRGLLLPHTRSSFLWCSFSLVDACFCFTLSRGFCGFPSAVAALQKRVAAVIANAAQVYGPPRPRPAINRANGKSSVRSFQPKMTYRRVIYAARNYISLPPPKLTSIYNKNIISLAIF